MRKANKWSIKQIFLFVQTAVIVAIVLVLVFNVLVISQFHNIMDTILAKNDALNNVFMYDIRIREYAYNYLRHQSDPEDYLALEKDFYQAFDELYNSVHLERTRIFLWGLRNMFAKCFEHAETMMTYNEQGQSNAAYNEYQELLNICSLIDNTANRYHILYLTDLKSYLEDVARNIRVWSTVVLLISFVIIGMIAFVLRQQIGGIQKQIESLRAYAGEISRQNYIPIMEHRFDAGQNELDNLGSAMRQMASSIQGYITKIAEKDRKVLEMTRLENEYLRVYSSARDAEIHALNSQINPHFLFNTLGVVSQLCYIEGAARASEMLDSVIDTFQYMTRSALSISDLYSEIDFINKYVFICSTRYENQIQFSVKVDDNVPNVKLPGIIVQPIIENAILHGLKNCVQGGQVNIHVFMEHNTIYIQVEDNGAGMDYDNVEQVIGSVDSGSGHIGIQNVLKRLKLYFGDEADINIASEDGCGTIVTIVIPNR